MSDGAGGQRKECDLVMEGGLVSGILYPAAVLELHHDYDFRCVGGTSAGAFVAAATAAAQMNRAGDGFARLGEFSDALAAPHLAERLFQASPGTRPLLAVGAAILRASTVLEPSASMHRVGVAARVLRVLISATRRRFLVGSLAGLVLFLVAVRLVDGSIGPMAVLLAAICGLAGGLVAALRCLLRALLHEVPRNHFGLASGLRSRPGDEPALTEWLSAWLDRIAGLAANQRPLTLGDLEAAGVTLRTLTTNLSEMRPYVVPLARHRFIFNTGDMRRLFPRYVVDHLLAHADRSAGVELPGDHHFLPDATDLPAIVAVRLSNSFPLLLSAIPLYAIDAAAAACEPPRRLERADLCRVWFSDGGICSNFPIHFFDHWIPDRPTFGISVRAETGTHIHVLADSVPAAPPQEAVSLPVEPAQAEPAACRRIESVPGFLAAALAAALNHRDTLQRELPGYRERVVRVTLPAGGASLAAMSPDMARHLIRLGQRAGTMLRGFRRAQHRWVRLCALLPRLSEESERLGAQLRDPQQVQKWADQNAQERGGPVYPRSPEWTEHAQRFLAAVAGASGHLSASEAAENEPIPPSVLRLTPRDWQAGQSAARQRSDVSPGTNR